MFPSHNNQKIYLFFKKLVFFTKQRKTQHFLSENIKRIIITFKSMYLSPTSHFRNQRELFKEKGVFQHEI